MSTATADPGAIDTGAIDVRGVGVLARRLADRLAGCRPLRRTTVLVAPLDQIDDVLTTDIRSQPHVLYVGHWRSVVYIGPLWRPGEPGCPRCLVARTANSPFGPDVDGHRVVRSSGTGQAPRTFGAGRLSAVGTLTAARLDGTARLPDSAVLVFDCLNGQVEPQPLLPDSVCPTCGDGRPRDTVPEFADRALPKLSPRTLRSRPLDHGAIERDYLFPGIGLFTELRLDLQSPFGACSVELPTRWGVREPAIGRSATYRDAQSIAVLEGLERYAGLHRGGHRETVRACYADVADRALYPPSLGLHPAQSYCTPGFRYRPFDPETVVDWVWAYSFASGDRLLVPERAAYWGRRPDPEVSFCYDTSNGCAVGATAEEATLHGLRELAERDSFLLTWYRRLALPEVSLADAADRTLRELVRRVELVTGFRIRAFLSTMEYGLPSFWLAAIGTGDCGPSVVAGSGAHPDPVQALLGGIYELAGTVLRVRESYPRERPAGLPMLDDPFLVQRMEQHCLVNCLPEARERFAFLLDSATEPVPLSEVPATVRTDEDLRADLAAAVHGLLAAGLDVLVVDQTMPELAAAGLVCVKAIVPGLVPVTFGHLNRRTENLPRLAGAVPLPYRSQLPPSAEPGALPHPFP